MLSLFRSRNYLKDILPKNYIDIHNHILPGIDDGSKTVTETSFLISEMKLLNIDAAIATPHIFNGLWNNNEASIKNAYDQATNRNLNTPFLRGYASEYMLDKSLIAKSHAEDLLVLPKNYLLVEINLFNNPLDLYEMLFELKTRNYKIILAHPERYLYLHHVSKYQKLKDFGIYFQLNLLSLTGYYGKAIQKKALELLSNDFYDFTGTDIHSEAEIKQFKKVPLQIPNKRKLDSLLQNNSLFL